MTSTMAATDAGRRRLLVIVAIAAAVLLAALVLPRVLLGGGGGGDEEEVTAPPTTTGTGSAADDDVVDELADELGALPDATFSTKNPFTPLVAIGAATGPATDTGTTTDEVGETGDVPSDDATGDTGGTGGATGTGAEPDRAAARLSIVEIYTGTDGAPVATVQVDGAYFTVSEGEAFGGGYQVVSLSQASRTGVFSRDGQQFTVREGEARLK